MLLQLRKKPAAVPMDELLRWNPALSVGNGLIDGEHRQIVDLLNRIWDDWRHRRHGLNLGRTMLELTETVETHFANEEEILIRHRCPRSDEHQRAHLALLSELNAIAARIGTEDSAHTEERLVRFIRHLVMDHIVAFDLELKAYMHN